MVDDSSNQDPLDTTAPAGSRPAPTRQVSLRRVGTSVGAVVALCVLAYAVWSPGRDWAKADWEATGVNGLWMRHGWLGDDEWFTSQGRELEIPEYRDPANIAATARELRVRIF